jgi:hypothetical protein
VDPADIVTDLVVEMPHIRRGHRDEFRETTVAIDSDDLREGTHVRIPSSAQETSAIDNVTLGGDAISLLHVGHETPNLHDIACEFMSDDERRPASGFRPVVPVVDVHVCAAHACSSHANQNFIIAYAWLRNVAHDEARSG